LKSKYIRKTHSTVIKEYTATSKGISRLKLMTSKVEVMRVLPRNIGIYHLPAEGSLLAPP